MNILTSTCGRLKTDPCTPPLLKNLLVQSADYHFYSYDVGKLLVQEFQVAQNSVQIFHLISHLEEEYSFALEPDSTYLIINLVNTFNAQLDHSELKLYENGICFFKMKQGKVLWKSASAHEHKFILIKLSSDNFQNWCSRHSYFSSQVELFPNLKTEFISKFVATPKILNLYHHLEEEENNSFREIHLNHLIESCIKLLNKKAFPHASKLKDDEIQNIYLFKHILQYNMQNDISIEDISKELGLNERRLRTGFRRIYGVSIFEYILHLRMENARRLIDQSNIKINKIAYLVGYQSKFTFAAAFRKYFKNKPSYTRRIKSDE